MWSICECWHTLLLNICFLKGSKMSKDARNGVGWPGTGVWMVIRHHMDAVNWTWSSAGVIVLLVIGPSLQPILLLVIQSIVLISLLSSFSGEINLCGSNFADSAWFYDAMSGLYFDSFQSISRNLANLTTVELILFILPSVSQGQSITDIE